MTYRLQNMMLAMLLALITLFVGLGTFSQNPTSGGYQLFERAALGHQADIQLASLDNFAPSLETASEYANAPKGGWSVSKDITGKFPEAWGSGNPTKKGVGTRWTDPNNPGNGVRIDQGNPANSQTTQQVDHVIVRSNGQVIGRDGKPITGSIADNAEMAHIPLSEYQTWTNWNLP